MANRFCSGGTEGDIGVCKNCLDPKTAAFGRRQKLEMLEKESQRILNIKVKLYDSFAEEILDRTEFETFKAKYDQSLEEIRQAMECQQRETPKPAGKPLKNSRSGWNIFWNIGTGRKWTA